MTGSKSEKRRLRKAKRNAQERRRKSKNLIVIILLALGLIYLSLQTDQSAEPLASEQIIARGAEVYAETCSACHGNDGEGHLAVFTAPALDGSEHSWHHPDGQIQTLILNGGVEMPALRDQLADEDIVAVIRFIQTRWSANQLASQQRASQSNPMQ